MKLFTNEIRQQLIHNHQAQKNGTEEERDFVPVVKLFTPDAGATWLLTELEEESQIAFGLCDLGLGCPELGYVSLTELQTVRGSLGLPVERDRFFEGTKSLSEYFREALSEGRIIA